MTDLRAVLRKDLHPLPAGWAWRWFTDVMDIEGGTQPPASTFAAMARPGYVRLVQIRDFDSDTHLTYIPDSRKWRKCGRDDVLIARYGAALGRICRGLDGAYNVALAKVVVTDEIKRSFAYYLLKSAYFQGPLLAMGGRSAQAGLNKDGLAVIALPVPPLPEQDAIVSILSALDDKIDLNRRMNETLEAMARAIFKDWFVEFGPTRAKMDARPPYLAPDLWALFPDRLDEEGKPEGWDLSTIGSEVKVLGGSTPSTTNPAYWDGTFSWATPKDLSRLSSPVLTHTERQITEQGLTQIGSGLLPSGTLLLSSRAPIGYLAISQVPVAVNQGFIAMVCDGRLSNVFCWLWSIFNMEEIKQRANGSTFLEISKANFRPIPVIMPSDDLLRAFDRMVRPLHSRIAQNMHESRTLESTRDLLLPKLMSGEVRVRDAENLLGAVA
ncbi:restriction endonuclease subunit S [Pseudoroseomonas sp. WGS1072]|uniref:restriction endonuclease subunit S n=1 Tax=Roseomonas sp. WGS1072 TaxID=3366816 RepID=UPI003BF31F27